MTLPSSGILTLSEINVELGKAANSPISLNDSDARALAGILSGPISLSNFYGKSIAPAPGAIDWTTAGVYYWTVPANVTSIAALLVGAGAGGGGGTLFPGQDGAPGGGGGSGYITQIRITVIPGEILTIVVGYGGIAGVLGNYGAGGNGGNGGVSLILRGKAVLGTIAGGIGGTGCYGWSGYGIWGNCGQIASPGGGGLYTGNSGGAGNSDWNSSYVPGNGAGVGGPPTFASSGGIGLNGFVGAVNSLTRWQGYMWLQGQGAGGGGYIGSGNGRDGGAGGGGGGGGLAADGGIGGCGYIRISWG